MADRAAYNVRANRRFIRRGGWLLLRSGLAQAACWLMRRDYWDTRWFGRHERCYEQISEERRAALGTENDG